MVDNFGLLVHRMMDVILSIINVIFAVILLVAPWYKVTLDTLFHKCLLPRGTLISPFFSGLCEIDTFFMLPEVGSEWNLLHNLCIVYVSISMFTVVGVAYEAIQHGMRELNHANKLSLLFTIIMLTLQIVILSKASDISKPEHVENELAPILLITGIVISSVRIPMIFWIMKKMYDDPERLKRGIYFAVGGEAMF